MKITIADDDEPVFSLCGEPWTPPKSVDERFWDGSMSLEAIPRNNDRIPHSIKQESWLKRAVDWCLTPPEYDDGV